MLVLAACGPAAAASHASLSRAAPPSPVTIPAADRFAPFALVVQRGARVTFRNADSDPHSAVSTPGSPAAFSGVLQPGAAWTVTLSQSGVYHYYCSIHARFDPATGEVEALPNADRPAEPMEGVIVVS